MYRSFRCILAFTTGSLVVMAAGLFFTAIQAGANQSNGPLAGINHIVVIYEENHSFDNLMMVLV